MDIHPPALRAGISVSKKAIKDSVSGPLSGLGKAAVAAKKDPGSTRASWLHSPRETAAGARRGRLAGPEHRELREELGAKKTG